MALRTGEIVIPSVSAPSRRPLGVDGGLTGLLFAQDAGSSLTTAGSGCVIPSAD